MKTAGKFGNYVEDGRTESFFTPASGGENSGYRFVYPVTGGKITASGSAMLSIDGWLVAVRMSSPSLSPSDLDARLAEFVSGLRLPKAKGGNEQAYAILDCPPGGLPTKEAQRAEADMATAILGSSFMGITLEDSANTREAAPFCRLESNDPAYSVYQRKGQTDAYVIAFNDAGMVLDVGRDAISTMSGKEPTYPVIFRNSEDAAIFTGFRSLPTVEQALKVFNTEGPVGGTGRTPATSRQIKIYTSGK